MAERIARALNLHGVDRDLLSTDRNAVLDMIDEYWADDSDAVNNLFKGSVTMPIIIEYPHPVAL